MALVEEAHKAARLLLDHAYVRILARQDPAAVCAATLLVHALRREGVDVHVSWAARLSSDVVHQLSEERNDALVLVGFSGDATTTDAPALHKVILDSTPTALVGSAVLDPSHAQEGDAGVGLGGLAHLLAVAISKRNVDLAPLALAASLAAWGDMGSPSGLDAQIVAEAIDAGVVLREPALALSGSTLLTALSSLDAPYVSGLTGRARNAKKLVGDLHLSGDAPPGGLTPSDAERLGSFLAVRLLAQDAPDVAIDALFRPTLRALQGPHTGMDVRDMARLAEACVAQSLSGLALAALWPDAAGGAEALEVAAAVREELVAALLRAERERRLEGRLAIVEAPRAGLCGPLADRVALALTPAGHVAVARHAEGEGVTLAMRSFGNAADLGSAARHAANACGGYAWGERGRACVSVPALEETRFLKALSETLG